MESLESLRSFIDARRPNRLSAGYPREVRARVAEYVPARRAAGLSAGDIADELGLSRNSIVTWCKPTVVEVPAGLVPVEVSADGVASAEDAGPASEGTPLQAPAELPAPAKPPEGSTAAVPARERLMLISPRGFRVEGLDLDALGVLLGRLG